MGQTVNIVLIINTPESNKDNKLIKDLETFIPLPPCCGINITTLCVTELTVAIMDIIEQNNPDLICHYGLGQSCFWPEHTTLVKIKNKDIPLILDNHDTNNLFYGTKFIYTTHFEVIKAAIAKIDLIKSRPTKLFTARTLDDLKYIENRNSIEPFGFDTETNFLNPFIKEPEPLLLCYSTSWLSDEEEGWTIPISQTLLDSGNCLYTLKQAKEHVIKAVLESPQQSFIHNAAYDLLVFFELFDGLQPKNFTACTMLLLSLYHHANKSAALKENTHLIGLPSYKDPVKNWIETQNKQKGISKKSLGYEDVPLEIISPYAAMDAIAVIRLVNFLRKNLSRSLWEFYFKVPHKILLTSNELACKGYTISRDRFNYTKFLLETQIREIYTKALDSVKEYTDPNFNIGSPKQLGELLFDENKLNLPIFSKTTNGAPATNIKTLDDLILFHPFIFQLIKVKKLQKLYSTYSYKGYAGVLNEGSRKYKKTGNWTINAQYRQTNRTARLGSSNMNQHNGINKKGGNILVLPAQGSMIKQYFNPNIVSDAENILYQHIVSTLSDEDKKKLKDAEVYNLNTEIKPQKEKKAKKVKNVSITADPNIIKNTE